MKGSKSVGFRTGYNRMNIGRNAFSVRWLGRDGMTGSSCRLGGSKPGQTMAIHKPGSSAPAMQAFTTFSIPAEGK
jgi:hypothetical protein